MEANQQFLTTDPTTVPTPEQLATTYLEGYVTNIIPDSITITRTKRAIKYTRRDYADIPMFGEALCRPHLQPLSNIKSKRCVYDILTEDHGLTMPQIKEVIPHRAEHGVSAEEFQRVIRHYNINAVVVDLLDRPIVNNTPTLEERDGKPNTRRVDHLTNVYVMADSHLYRVSEEQRQLIVARQKGAREQSAVVVESNRKRKQANPPTIVHVNSWEEAKQYQPPILIRRVAEAEAKATYDAEAKAAEGLKKTAKRTARRVAKAKYQRAKADIKARYADVKGRVNQRTRIIVNQDNLFNSMILEMRNNTAYKSDLDLSKRTCNVVQMSRSVTVYANPDYQAMSNLAGELGLIYGNQTISALALQFFRSINNGRWVSSTMTASVRRMIGGASEWNRSWAVTVADGEVVHGIDLYRCYTSCAIEVNPLVVDLLCEPYEFDADAFKAGDGELDSTCLYVVNTTQSILFSGCGTYTAELVQQGLDDGLIRPKHIEYVIPCKPAPQNRAVIHDYVNRVIQLPVDAHRKKLVNYLIGNMATGLLVSGAKSDKTIVSREADAHYLRTMSAHDDVTINTISAEEHGLANDLYQVSVKPRVSHPTTDAIVRKQIVELGRLAAYRLYKRTKAYVAQHDGVVCQVKTDCVIYTLPAGVPPMPADNSRAWGSTRTEYVEQVADFSLDTRVNDVPVRVNIVDEWDVHRASKTEDYDTKELMSHDRALVTGDAGTGKSYVLKELVEAYRAQGKSVAVLAFTNAAARLIGGKTFHSAWCLDIQGRVTKPVQFTKWVADTDIVVVDEVSMVPYQVYTVLANLPQRIKLYCFGDFKQLPPVECNIQVNYEDSAMLKDMLNGVKVVLRKNHRADDSFARAARKYKRHCDKVEDKLDEVSLPSTITQVRESDIQPHQLPLANLCYTNAKRRDVNAAVIKREAQARGTVLRTDRVRTYNTPAGQERHCVEHINADLLAAVVANPAAHRHLFGEGDERETAQKVHMISKLLANSEPHDGPIRKVRSSFARANKLFKGRQYAHGSVSLQNMPRRIRELAARGQYIDIDMVNAHPTIYRHFCQLYDMPCQFVGQYVDDREAVLRQLGDELDIDRKVAKTLVLELLNGSSLEYQLRRFKLNEHPFLTGLAKEVEANATAIVDMESVKYAEFTRHLHDEGLEPERRPRHRFINQFLCQHEARILNTIVNTLANRDMLGRDGDEYVPCFDGVMVPRSRKLLRLVQSGLLDELTDVVFKRWGIQVGLAVKPMEQHDVTPVQFESIEGSIRHLVQAHRLDEFPYVFPELRVISNWTERDNGVIRYVKNHTDVVAAVDDETGTVTMESGLVIPIRDLQLKWRPAYCITTHKSQGMSIDEPYVIHEFDQLPSEGRYVALTRTTNPDLVTVIRAD